MLKAYRRTIKVKGQEIKVVTLKPRNALLLAFREELKKNEKILKVMGLKID
jgi:hypothetical protein